MCSICTRSFAIEHREVFEAWQKGSNYLCCLGTKSLQQLHSLAIKLEGYKITKFYEPDLNNELTAIAVQPLNQKNHKRFFNKLKLT